MGSAEARGLASASQMESDVHGEAQNDVLAEVHAPVLLPVELNQTT